MMLERPNKIENITAVKKEYQPNTLAVVCPNLGAINASWTRKTVAMNIIMQMVDSVLFFGTIDSFI